MGKNKIINFIMILFPLSIIILEIYFLSIPYKQEVDRKLQDTNVRYQVMRKITKDYIDLYDIPMVIYDTHNSKMDFWYNELERKNSITDIDRIGYSQAYISDGGGAYIFYIFVEKDGKIYYRGRMDNSISFEEYNELVEYFLTKTTAEGSEIYEKVEPFDLKLRNPKEFYEKYKEYFFPYYLGDYKLKSNKEK